MKLKSGCIYWPQIYPGPEPHYPTLTQDLKCDVAIIGGGVSGALVAYHLARESIECVMIDRNQVGHGSTAASTGLLQYEIDTSLIDLAEILGKERAIAAYRASLESLLAFEPLVSDLGDPSGLVPRPSLYLASNDSDVGELRAECEARQSMQIEVDFLDREALRETFNISRPAAIWSRRAFEVDPFRLTLKLIQRAVQMGLQVFTETAVTNLESHSGGMVVGTSTGHRVTAKKIIFTTGYETIQKLPPDLCRLTSTYALTSDPLADFTDWPQRCLIWEAARPYLYMRTTEDNRVIIGGADEEIVDPLKRDKLLKSKAAELRAKGSEMFPDISIEIACAWAGTFAQTKDGLPYIGTLPQFPHSYFALGYGGNGITFSLLAAEILRDLFLGKETEKSALFGFNR
jgi:glycine/D-amino acid oxidase-like deaminating enzyme